MHGFAHGNARGAGHDFCNLFCAYHRAQQARRIRFAFLGFFSLSILELLFKFWQRAVLQLSHLVEIAFARELFDLKAQLVNLFFDVRTALGLGFFSLPNFFQISRLFSEFYDFFVDQA